MSEQNSLFGPALGSSAVYPIRPAARRSGPETSRVAASMAQESASAQRERIVAELQRTASSSTYREIAAALGVEPVVVARRMAELERSDLVERVGVRTGSTGRPMTTWRATA